VLLTVSTTRAPATDLGYLLHKHPQKLQSFEVAVGSAHVFYPQATDERCTAALLLEVDPIGLVRGRRGRDADGPLAQYVNDRPYAASSMLAVAMSRVFKTAMAGRCDARPELAASALPLELHLPALACRGGPELATRLFEPLGWTVTATAVPLDTQFPDWGDSDYVDLHLAGTLRLADALHHLYVLLPVLDDAKHYWVSPDEVDKLVRAGGGWLATHSERDLITRRYLRNLRTLVDSAVDRLAEVDDDAAERGGADEPAIDEERAVPLVQQRHDAVLAAVRESGARRVADLGCGEGALLVGLLADPAFTHVLGADVASRALERAARRLHLDEMPDRQRERLTLIQSSLTYRDSRLAGFDAAVLMEVIEHLDPPRLPALGRTVFGDAAPATVIVTTPNAEYNARFAALPGGEFRHSDHRFEWTRAEFAAWADRICRGYGYTVRFSPVGPEDPAVGSPTQLAVFTRNAGITNSSGAS
jgi:3' terminal RNA ribose 2'-O-methyltransferase Hen1